MNKPLSYIEISKSNLRHNFNLVRSYINPQTKIVCVVKANAYGHGLEEVVKTVEDLTDYLQVDDLLELKALREFCNKPTLVLGYVAIHELEEALKLGAILAVYDYERLEL